MKTKVQIAMVHNWSPVQHLRDLIEKSGDSFINIGVGDTLLAEAEKDQWIKDHIVHESQLKNNIADRNFTYCEATAFYALWKNQSKLVSKDTTHLGLCHYRRRFDIDEVQALADMHNFDIVCATPESMGTAGLQFGIKGQYIAAHNAEDWNLFEDLIRESSLHQQNPEVTDRWMKAIMLFAPCNLVVMKRSLLDDWCDRMFRVLNDIYEKRIDDIKTRDNYQRRAIGFLAERFTSWYVTQQALGHSKVVAQVPVPLDELAKPVTANDNRPK